MAPFSKPEAVLKQAEGLVAVGQSHAALQSLAEMFTSKRFRSAPLPSLEPIMNRFIELCVDMRKGRTAKEGLMQYKNIAQNTSVQSIETVVTRFIQLADAKVKEAQAKAAVQNAAVDVDDLEASETPESILLGAVSGDQSKDRTDRALVTPWLKFLWETYRTCLETLKNNARLEPIYQNIAQQAFKFCLTHDRKVEFRRLCETIRTHLSNVAKYAHQAHSINLSDADTLQHHLDTRFAQLNTSVELELWQEAFRSVEDVHNLLNLAKKAPKPAMMANYYEKLTKIFLMSGNALYHAAAWGRYYAVVVSIGGKSEEELGQLAGQVLVSALAVPVGVGSFDEDESRGRNTKLAALLGLTKAPTRAGLLKDALSRNVLRISPESVQKLYSILEVAFEPLSLCSSIAPLFTALSSSKSYAPYLPLLQRALLSRLLSQLSQVYDTITITNLLDLVRPLQEFGVDEALVESYIMGCARRGELNVRVDHAQGSITFIDEGFSTRDDAPGPSTYQKDKIQASNEERVRTRLSDLATRLHNTLITVYPRPKDDAENKLATLIAAAETEHKALASRVALVAWRRELLSELSVRKEQEEQTRRAEIERREKDEESRRAKEEFRKRELERVRKEMEDIRAEEAKKLAQTLADKGVKIDMEKPATTDELLRLGVERFETQKKEMAQRLKTIAKRIDHTERAYRKEERPLLAQDYERQQEIDRKSFEASQAAHKETHKATHQRNLETKERLARMVADYQARKEAITKKKGEEFARRQATAAKKIEEEKEKRKEKIKAEREAAAKKREEEERVRREKEEAAMQAEAERQAEEERLREEAERAEAEAEAKREEEVKLMAEQRSQREKERAEAAEKARLQQLRQDEAEARRAAARAERQGAPRPSVPGATGDVWRRSGPSSAAPPTPTRASALSPPSRPESPSPASAAPKYRPGALGGGSGGWRERQAAKEATTAKEAPPASPTPAQEEPKTSDDGFQTVTRTPGVWRRGRGRG